MRKPEFKPYYDVIVIGSGVSGLTSAALLSKAGFSVCVLEMDSRPGGYLAGFRRKDFRFDTAIHWLNQCGPGGLVYKTFQFLGNDFPRPKTQTLIRRMKGESFDYLLTNNPNDLKEQWIREFPHEKKGIERFFKDGKQLGRSFKILGNAYRSMETMSLSEKMAFGFKMLNFGLPFFRHLRFSGEEGMKKGLNKYFKDPRLHEVFGSEQDLLSCLVPIGWAYYSDYQMPPEGGSQVFPEWLSHIVEFFHNDIFFKCRVTKIITENNTSQGVELESRGVHYTVKSKYVIAACDVETLYEKMLPPDAVSESFKEKLRKAPLYSSSMTLSVALDCHPSELGFGEEMIFISKEGIPKNAHTDSNPHTSGISILAPSLRDPSLAPDGQGTLTLYTAADMHYRDNWGAEKDENGNFIRGEKYNQVKEEFAQIIIDRVEALYPGLRKHILFYDIATPVTHLRYTGNRNGSIMGARPGKENVKAKIAHHRTPVKNLLLGGHWAELGGGVPIAVKSGANTALLVMKDEKNPAFRLLADYMDGKVGYAEVKSSKLLKTYDNSWVQNPTPADKKRQKLPTD
ncbi:MAG: NAD(P)/FAD-dependent oxidoreductase [Flavobacteriales bacterium]|nr:NAD(P)/FAD-dependent oxidoreductase [Flavobacteriales bacterium]